MTNLYLKFILVNLAFSLVCHAAPELGMTRASLIAELGEPTGRGGNGKNLELLSFKGGVIELTRGKVTHVPEDFGQVTQKLGTTGFASIVEKVKNLFGKKTEKEASPLDALPPPEVTVSPEAQALIDTYGDPKVDKLDKVEFVITDGHSADIMGYVVPQKVTIIDFYAPWCGPCKEIDPGLQQLTQSNPDVYLRKINIVQFDSPIAMRYNITSIPSVWVFDRQGKQVGTPEWEIAKVTSNVEIALTP